MNKRTRPYWQRSQKVDRIGTSQKCTKMADMSIAAQYEALSKLLQPAPDLGGEISLYVPPPAPTRCPRKLHAIAESSNRRSQRSQPSSSTTTAEPLVDPQIAQASGRGYPSNASGGIWEDTEVPDQVTAGPSHDLRETPRYYPPWPCLLISAVVRVCLHVL